MSQLNAEQQRAVETVEGPLLVIAGAGSGKTRVVTTRIAHLIEKGVHPSQILGVTFTNKAAQEMQHRILQLTSSSVIISTFHSLCAKILRESIDNLGYDNNFLIYDEDDVQKLLRECLSEIGIPKNQVKAFRQEISQHKNGMSCLDHDQQFNRILELYQKKLKNANACDFDDLLLLTVELLEKFPEVLQKYQDRWHYFLVDEYQDTNEAQYRMVNLLCSARRNLCVVGDPDQSIYSWRGAQIKNILDFQKDYPEAVIVPLEQNYRSHNTILEAASAVISHNSARLEKKLWSEREKGPKIELIEAESDYDEAEKVVSKLRRLEEKEAIPLSQMVVFYRTNFQSRVLEDRLLYHNIPYRIVGGVSFYQRKEIKDILAYLKLLVFPKDIVSFMRVINLPKRGLGEAIIGRIKAGAESSGIPVLDFIEQGLQTEFAFRVTKKQLASLNQFLDLLADFRRQSLSCSIADLLEKIFKGSGYEQVIQGDPETFEDRLANIQELIVKATEWEIEAEDKNIELFLEEITLKSDHQMQSLEQETVTLMTLHNGKGLEYEAVFLTGLEEDLLPHVNSRASKEAQEEERRLMYVGITRSKNFLTLSFAKERHLFGSFRMQRPSRFIREIPKTCFQEKISYIERGKNRFFDIGDHIYHKEFGEGTVEGKYQTSFGLTYRIYFQQEAVTKSVVAKYGQLELCNA